MTFESIYGVDFSGAKEAGRNIWIARAEPTRRGRLCLLDLVNLDALAGTAERAPSLQLLVEMIARSRAALWGMDFPFGMPIELYAAGFTWPRQLDHVNCWKRDAYAYGLWCVERAKRIGREMHIRRATDTHAKAPFDCYHYRIIYQTFFGMRDVLLPLSTRPRTAILPFQYRKLTKADRVITESCPGSTLKRLGLPHQNYKQPTGGPLTRRRRHTRHAILAGLMEHIDIPPSLRRTIMRNPGGDALDAVIAAVGVQQAWQRAEHNDIRRDARYRLEGFLYV
jgi:hypothetical protein